MKRSLSAFNTFVVVDEGMYYTKSNAALRVIKQLDGCWPVLFALVLIPRFIRDVLYDWLARNRYRLFGKRECRFVPESHLKDRFWD